MRRPVPLYDDMSDEEIDRIPATPHSLSQLWHQFDNAKSGLRLGREQRKLLNSSQPESLNMGFQKSLQSRHETATYAYLLASELNGLSDRWKQASAQLQKLINEIEKDEKDKEIYSLFLMLQRAFQGMSHTPENLETSMQIVFFITKAYNFKKSATIGIAADSLQSQEIEQLTTEHKLLSAELAGKSRLVPFRLVPFLIISSILLGIDSGISPLDRQWIDAKNRLHELLTQAIEDKQWQTHNAVLNLQMQLNTMPETPENKKIYIRLIAYIENAYAFTNSNQQPTEQKKMQLLNEFQEISNNLQGKGKPWLKVLGIVLIISAILLGIAALCVLIPPIGVVFLGASATVFTLSLSCGISSLITAIAATLAVGYGIDTGVAKAANNVVSTWPIPAPKPVDTELEQIPSSSARM